MNSCENNPGLMHFVVAYMQKHFFLFLPSVTHMVCPRLNYRTQCLVAWKKRVFKAFM